MGNTHLINEQSSLLGRYLNNIYPNWKVIYNNIIEDFGGKVDLKEDQMGNTHLINEQSSLFGSKALIASSENGHYEVVKLLLADGRVNPSVDDNKAIIQASKNGNPEVVKILLADERRETKVSPAYIRR